MRIVFQIDGMAELDRKLKLLPDKVEKKVIRTAVRNAQKIVLAALKAKTMALAVSRRWRGRHKALIAKAWQLRVPARQRKGSYALHVQLARNSDLVHVTKDGKRYYIPAVIEFGHGPSKDKTARPFARPAAEESKGQVETVLTDDLRRGLEQVAQERA